jgi:hypothetical protein
MSCRTVLLAALPAILLAGEAGAQLPSGRWYNVDNYRCRVFRDYVDHKPSVIGIHRDIAQRACAVLCNGTPNCAAYNYILRTERDHGRTRPSRECQLLNSVDQPVSIFDAKPGEAAYVCYKGIQEQPETPEFDHRNSFQDALRPGAPPPPPPTRID